jgi:hypothetical protein
MRDEIKTSDKCPKDTAECAECTHGAYGRATRCESIDPESDSIGRYHPEEDTRRSKEDTRSDDRSDSYIADIYTERVEEWSSDSICESDSDTGIPEEVRESLDICIFPIGPSSTDVVSE